MKKLGSILLGSLLVGGCAGTPPAWWTPNDTYPTPTVRITADSPSAVTPVNRSLADRQEEQPLALPDDGYEEMVLTPLQDEERENDSGEASSQTVVPLADELLPPPSVLE